MSWLRRMSENGTVRGFAIIAVVAAVIVALSLEDALLTASALVRIAFFIAIAFFLFLVWRERRSDIETWSERSRRVFYGAIALAVVDIGMLLGLTESGPDAVAFLVVLACCAYAMFRVWRDEHRYS